jgi:hypothetical protein
MAKKLMKKTLKAGTASSPSPTKNRKPTYPRAGGNPFRPHSSYSIAYDILSKHQEGLPRQKLIALLAKATRKSPRRAGFDASVILSAKNSVDGPRHRSCRSGFWVQRENDFVKLRTD